MYRWATRKPTLVSPQESSRNSCPSGVCQKATYSFELLQGANRIIRWVEILRTIPTQFEGHYAQYKVGEPE